MDKKDDNDYIFQIVLLGETAVGKSSFILRYAQNTFNSLHMTTVGIDFQTKVIEIDNKKVFLKIWDTAGQERFQNMTSQFYKTAEGILLLFALNDAKSFEKLENWINSIKDNSAKIPIVLIGNKSDLEQKVPEEKILEFTEKNSLCNFYFKTSAKLDINVKESYELLVREMIKVKEKPNEQIVDAKKLSIKPGSGKKKKCC